MTMNKRGNKLITEKIKNSFESTLDNLFKQQPTPRQKKDSATSLIIQHRSKIQLLLDKGYSAEQIAAQLATIDLKLSPETIRIVIRNTDDAARIKGKKTDRKVSTKTDGRTANTSMGSPNGKPTSASVHMNTENGSEPGNISHKIETIDAPFRSFKPEALIVKTNEELQKRGPRITIDDDL